MTIETIKTEIQNLRDAQARCTDAMHGAAGVVADLETKREAALNLKTVVARFIRHDFGVAGGFEVIRFRPMCA